MKWREYAGVGPASVEDVRAAESLLGFELPPDMAKLLMQHQGRVPEPRYLSLFDPRQKTAFGPLMHLNAREGGADYIPNAVNVLRSGGYPAGLIPFSTDGSQVHFALDYRERRTAPTIVYAVLELGYDHPNAFREVAPSVTTLLALLEAS
ncbi:MAG: SMI1/KNR4 family protein [Myxococcota bacterium]|nr:SMI1/KNR4 family protein [Myxococcota bacterium]